MHRRTTDTAASSRPCRTNASREARSIWAGGNSHSHRHPTQIPAAVLEAPVQVQATDAQVAEGGAGSVSSAGEVSPGADRANLLPMPAPAGWPLARDQVRR